MKSQTPNWMHRLVLGFVLALAPITVQAKVGHSPKTTSEQNVPAPVLSPQEAAVRHALLMLPYYGVFDNLEYKVEGDKVELSGQVTWPVLARDAQRVVERVEGVQQVINHIEVLPVSPMDDHIRLMVYRKIYRNSAMHLYAIQPIPPIRIIVKNGNVTLVGMVSRSMDKAIANIEANSVPGVFSVTNDLRVES